MEFEPVAEPDVGSWYFHLARDADEPVEVLLTESLLEGLYELDPCAWYGLISYVESEVDHR